MKQCIGSADCENRICDKSCPFFATSANLLEKNAITMKHRALQMTKIEKDFFEKAIQRAERSNFCTLAYVSPGTTGMVADKLTYYAICKYHSKSQMHVWVYNLNFTEYTEGIRNSWETGRRSDRIQDMDIYIESTKLLIVSGLEYLTFRDFECQTLLKIIEKRRQLNLPIVIVSRIKSGLQGYGQSQLYTTMLSVIYPEGTNLPGEVVEVK